MRHVDEVRLLRKRAKSFFARARDSLAYGDYDVAVFLAEQALQLYLKSVILEELGDFPRTHSLTFLITQFRKLPQQGELVNLLEKSKTVVRLMEDAYIASRYLPRTYGEEDAKAAVELVEEVLKFGAVF